MYSTNFFSIEGVPLGCQMKNSGRVFPYDDKKRFFALYNGEKAMIGVGWSLQ